MKGQFFIISTVIMISALILITQYLYDYGKVDLTKVEEMQELKYIDDVENSLTSTVKTSCYLRDNLEKNLIYTEDFLKNKFLEKGVILKITHSDTTCPNVDFTVTINSTDFYIENKFSV